MIDQKHLKFLAMQLGSSHQKQHLIIYLVTMKTPKLLENFDSKIAILLEMPPSPNLSPVRTLDSADSAATASELAMAVKAKAA